MIKCFCLPGAFRGSHFLRQRTAESWEVTACFALCRRQLMGDGAVPRGGRGETGRREGFRDLSSQTSRQTASFDSQEMEAEAAPNRCLPEEQHSSASQVHLVDVFDAFHLYEVEVGIHLQILSRFLTNPVGSHEVLANHAVHTFPATCG